MIRGSTLVLSFPPWTQQQVVKHKPNAFFCVEQEFKQLMGGVDVIFVNSYAFTYLSLVFFFQIQIQIQMGFDNKHLKTEYSHCSISEFVKYFILLTSCLPFQAGGVVQPDCNRLVAPLDPGHL